MKTVNGLAIPQAVDYSNMGESFGSCADVVAAILTKAAELVGDDTSDAASIVIGTTYGLKIGTAAGQKIGFHGVTPVVQGVSSGAISITVPNSSIGGLSIPGVSYGAEAATIAAMRDLCETLRDNVATMATAVNAHETVLVNHGLSA